MPLEKLSSSSICRKMSSILGLATAWLLGCCFIFLLAYQVHVGLRTTQSLVYLVPVLVPGIPARPCIFKKVGKRLWSRRYSAQIVRDAASGYNCTYRYEYCKRYRYESQKTTLKNNHVLIIPLVTYGAANVIFPPLENCKRF